MERYIARRAAALVAAIGLGAAVSGQVIFSDVAFPDLATTKIPGLGDRSIEVIDRPVASPDGTKWAISLNLAGAPDTSDDVIVVWDGTNFVVVAQEGVTVTPHGHLVGPIDQDLAINDAGVVVFATNTDGPVESDEIVATVDLSGHLTVVAREGDAVPGGSAAYRGDAMDSVQIDNAGNVYLSSATADPADQDEVIVRVFAAGGGEVLFRQGVTIPAGQADEAVHAWENFNTNRFRVTGDGAHTLLLGNTLADSAIDAVLAFDNGVTVQEGFVAHPAFLSPADQVTPVQSIALAHNGDWYAIGDNDDGEVWAMRNGELLARQWEEIYPGAGLLWDDFLSIAADPRGNYVINGLVDDPDASRNGVLVVNGQRLIAREGDPVDADGNGRFDDQAEIGAFGIEDAIITADGRVLAQVSTRAPGSLVNTGELLLAFDLGLMRPCVCERGGDPAHVDVFDLLAYLDQWFAAAGPADLDGSGGADVFDLLTFLDCWFVASAGGEC